MEAWEIIDDTFERGDAEKLARLFRTSSEWWSSHRRRPKTEDYANGTGNVSPLTHWLYYLEQRFAVNPSSAVKLHKAVIREIDERFDLLRQDEMLGEVVPIRTIRRELSKEAFNAIAALDESEITDASGDDLTRWQSELEKLEEKVLLAITRIRIEKNLRKSRMTPADFGHTGVSQTA